MVLLYVNHNSSKHFFIPIAAIVFTIFTWYMVEPFYLAEELSKFPQEILGKANLSIFIYFFTLLALVILYSPRRSERVPSVISQDLLVKVANKIILVWVLCFLFGLYRMEWDIARTLFPVDARTSSHMWSRAAGADAGPLGFLVSTASYIYIICLASFGVIFSSSNRRELKILMLGLIILTWPYVFLQGSRNVIIIVVMPAVGYYLIFVKDRFIKKIFYAALFFLVTDISMKAVISFRNVGFSDFSFASVSSASHLGLNMYSELAYCIYFLEKNLMQINYGFEYFTQLFSFIPRAVWTSKPLVGIDYAVLRGYGASGSDIGVFATISRGVIGQATLAFGPYLGPSVIAMLSFLWARFLYSQISYGDFPRYILFLLGLALTFNMGRDVLFIVLWPFIFLLIGIKLMEYRKNFKLRF